MYTYLCFKLIVEVGIIKLNETEEQGTFLRNGVILGNFLLHILLQEGHVAQEATRKGPQQLEQQLNLRVVTPIKREWISSVHRHKEWLTLTTGTL